MMNEKFIKKPPYYFFDFSTMFPFFFATAPASLALFLPQFTFVFSIDLILTYFIPHDPLHYS
jgi:hypothetical protein